MATSRFPPRRWLSHRFIDSRRMPKQSFRSAATAASPPQPPLAIELHRLSSNLPSNAAERGEIYKAARELMFRTEDRKDALHRLTDAHELNNIAQIAVDLGIFRTLAAVPEKTFPIKDIATESTADPTLLLRILRFLAANGMLQQMSEKAFKASNLTLLLADPDSENTIRMNTLIAQPMMNKLPAFLKSTQYRNPVDSAKTLWQYHYQTDLPLFDWLRSHPEELHILHNMIGKLRVNQKTWTDVVPMEQFRLSEDEIAAHRVLFVDVGGGTGNQAIAIRQNCPELRGRVILQDLPQVIALADQSTLQPLDIETFTHDFFTPQPAPLQSAKIYFLRNVLHDWPDAKCVQILRHLRDAMAPDSILMIDEIVLPAVGAKTRAVHFDVMMMAVCAAMERSEKQWKALLEEAGLRMKDIYSLHEETHDCVIVAERVG